MLIGTSQHRSTYFQSPLQKQSYYVLGMWKRFCCQMDCQHYSVGSYLSQMLMDFPSTWVILKLFQRPQDRIKTGLKHLKDHKTGLHKMPRPWTG